MFKRVMHTGFDKQRGDTLVEVLIAIAVVSLILGGAYVTTNRSLLATRSAQERSIALKLAESQIEQLKGVVATNPDAVFGGTAPSPFCISAVTSLPVAATNAACAVGSNGSATTTEPIFHLSIAHGAAPSANQFTLTETWINVDGRHGEELQMVYRLYE